MTRLLPVALVCIAACALPAYAQSQKSSKPRAAAVDSSYGQRAEALRWADELAQKQGIDPAWLRQQLGQAQKLEQVRRLMTPSTGPKKTTARSWAVYRSRFIEPIRIRAGVRFWQQHSSALARAEREYGVPAEIIVGILGVETIYGQQMGNFRVLDALATLSFDFPSAHPRALERREFFRRDQAGL